MASPLAATSGSGSASGTGSSSGTGTGSSSSTANSATISANDFLTLLVTEMQNQDPTSQTDPNEYVNQLVAVNSLEQLIGINQTLTTDLGTPTSTSSTTGSGAGSTGSSGTGSSGSSTSGSAGSSTASGSASGGSTPSGQLVPGAASAQAMQSAHKMLAPGNLSVPPPDPSAQQVAHALDGRRRPAVVPALHALR